MSLPSCTRIWLLAGATDIRELFNGLGELVQHALDENPPSICPSSVVAGRYSDDLILWANAGGLCLFTKLLEEDLFIWPAVHDGKTAFTLSQLAQLLHKLDWRQPKNAI